MVCFVNSTMIDFSLLKSTHYPIYHDFEMGIYAALGINKSFTKTSGVFPDPSFQTTASCDPVTEKLPLVAFRFFLILTTWSFELGKYSGTKSFISVSSLSPDLSKNRLADVPTEVCHLVALETLNLYHNCIRTIPDSIIGLQSLTSLNLRYVHSQVRSVASARLIRPDFVHVKRCCNAL